MRDEHSDSDNVLDNDDPLNLDATHLETLAARGATSEMIRSHRAAALKAVNIPKDEMGQHFKDGAMHPLPLYAEDKRTAAKDRAGSTLHAQRNKWLNSEEGQTWMLNTRARWTVERGKAD